MLSLSAPPLSRRFARTARACFACAALAWAPLACGTSPAASDARAAEGLDASERGLPADVATRDASPSDEVAVIDALVFERTTRFSSDRAVLDEWRVEARVMGCRDAETLKALTRRGDQQFTLRSDGGDEVVVRGGVGGRVGDWGDGRGPQAFLVLRPRDRAWAPRSGERYRLVPRNRDAALRWETAPSATLRY